MPKPVAVWNSARDVWETPQTEGFFCEHLGVYLETFPTSGTTRNGAAYGRPTWEPRTHGSEFSSSPDAGTLLLTPVASEGQKPSNTMGVARRLTTGQVFLTNQIVTLCGLDPSEKLLPTPEAKLGSSGPDYAKAARGSGGNDLQTTVALHLLPTPVAQHSGNTPENHLRKKPGRGVVTDLAILVENDLLETGGKLKLLRTPCAAEAEGGPRNPNRPGATIRLSDQIREELTGETTSPPSGDGRLSSDGQLLGQLNLLDAMEGTA